MKILRRYSHRLLVTLLEKKDTPALAPDYHSSFFRRIIVYKLAVDHWIVGFNDWTHLLRFVPTMVPQKVSQSGWSVLGTALALLVLYSLARGPYRRGLRSIPGPYLARYSSIFRILLVRNGDAPSGYLELHKKYGPIVRTGPNHVSVSDPGMIPIIYGIGKRFNKV
jgi:hypothetical protein